jgi:hypothetical protein
MLRASSTTRNKNQKMRLERRAIAARAKETFLTADELASIR